MSVIFSVSVIAATLFMTHRFIRPLLWASIICVASWPLYCQGRKLFSKHETAAAATLTLIITLIILIPASWLLVLLTKESFYIVHQLILINKTGMSPPLWLHTIPFFGNKLTLYWKVGWPYY